VCWVVENILGELRASCSGVDNHFMPTETHEHGNGVQTKTPSGGGGGNGANVCRSNSSHRKKLLIACWGVYLETRNNEKKITETQHRLGEGYEFLGRAHAMVDPREKVGSSSELSSIFDQYPTC